MGPNMSLTYEEHAGDSNVGSSALCSLPNMANPLNERTRTTQFIDLSGDSPEPVSYGTRMKHTLKPPSRAQLEHRIEVLEGERQEDIATIGQQILHLNAQKGLLEARDATFQKQEVANNAKHGIVVQQDKKLDKKAKENDNLKKKLEESERSEARLMRDLATNRAPAISKPTKSGTGKSSRVSKVAVKGKGGKTRKATASSKGGKTSKVAKKS